MRNALLFLAATIILTASATQAEARKFRIGISCPLSGVLAEYGTAVRNGIELARETEPEKFKDVEIFYEDSKWDPKTAVAAFHSLHNVRKVDVIYNWGNPTSDAVAPVAEMNQVPVVAMSSDPGIAAGRKHIIRSINSSDELGRLLASYLESQGYKSGGVIIAENNYVEGLYPGLEAGMKSTGKAEALGRFALDEQKFASVVTRLKEKKIDALGVFLISGQVSSFYRQLAIQHLDIPTFSADFIDSRNEITSAGPSIDGAVFPTFDVVDSYRQQYETRYGNNIQIQFAANADGGLELGERGLHETKVTP